MIHIANGHSLATLIENAGLPGERAVWCDPLHEGPVPDVGHDALRAIRAAWIADGLGRVTDHDVLDHLQRSQRAVDDAHQQDEAVLWYEHDLFDQLNLIQLLDALTERRPARVSLVSINAYPGHPRFRGMGELTPGDIASLFARRQPVGDEQYSLARQAWAAFRAEDPREIERLIAGDTSALPFLAAALRRHLEEFPSLVNGLSRTEHNILALLEAGTDATTLDTLFELNAVDEEVFFIADLSFGNLLKALASSTPALIRLEVATIEPSSLPPGRVWLTDEGARVLNGGVDRVRLCGIDRWLGGVHLEAHGPTWRWDSGLGALTWA